MFTFVLTMKMILSLTVLLVEYFGTRIEYCVEGTVKKLRVFQSSSSGQEYMGKEWKRLACLLFLFVQKVSSS